VGHRGTFVRMLSSLIFCFDHFHRDGTIVSGDSMGMVKFWDPNTSTQLQSFTAHGADVLCLAISASNNAVYTSGVDQKVAEFISVEVSTGKPSALSTGKQKRWIQSCARRLHSHDVRCVAMWPPQSLFPFHVSSTGEEHRLAPLLVTGGLDTSPVFTPCASPIQDRLTVTNPFNRNGPASFEEAHYHRTSFTRPVVCFSSKARLVACRYDNKVVLWRISAAITKDDGDIKGLASAGWRKILEMQLKLKNNISSIALSVDGRWLAVADHLEVKVFHLYEVIHRLISFKYLILSFLG
jgi:U3 small nucleolar RNA-associated protein 4